MQRRIDQRITDADTGEIYEGAQLAVIFPKRRNGFQHQGWIAMAQTPMEALALSGIGLQAYRVFALLIARVDYENWINVNQAELAEKLGMHRQAVGRAMTDLEHIGLLLRGPKVGRNATWRLDPAYGWKGTAANHRTALNDRLKASGLAVLQGGKA